MALNWYQVLTYSGYENKARESLQERIKLARKEDQFGEIVIPAVTERFPGQMYVQMEWTNENYLLVAETLKVTGFLGGRGAVPIRERDVPRP